MNKGSAQADPRETLATHEGFLAYARFRYLKLAIVVCIASSLAYLLDRPVGGANGGTALGYTLGSVGALLILWLTWLGMRRRHYRSRWGSVRGWTSAHVYLGISLTVVATLHCAFHFGWNVHTLAYGLMLVVIVSGLYGILVYARYPRLITANREGASPASWLNELTALDEQALKLADTISPDLHDTLVRSVERREIGGDLRSQLFGSDARRMPAIDLVQKSLSQRLLDVARPSAAFDPTALSTISIMADELAAGDRNEAEAGRIRALLDLLARRREIAVRLNRDIRMHARMRIWLFLHVPMSFALLAALAAHVLSVFLYW